jgi:hypothetical protein
MSIDSDIDRFIKNLDDLTRGLTDKRKDEFYGLLDKFIFKLHNSANFKQRCCRQIDQGLNPLLIFLEKNNFIL